MGKICPWLSGFVKNCKSLSASGMKGEGYIFRLYGWFMEGGKDEFLRQYYARSLSGCGPLIIDIKQIMSTRTQTSGMTDCVGKQRLKALASQRAGPWTGSSFQEKLSKIYESLIEVNWCLGWRGGGCLSVPPSFFCADPGHGTWNGWLRRKGTSFSVELDL